MYYHHPVCYHRLVDALKQQRPSFKGFKVGRCESLRPMVTGISETRKKVDPIWNAVGSSTHLQHAL